MNKVILMGRLTRDPEVRYSAGDNATAVARYTLAVDRRFKRDGEATADLIGCVAFGRQAEFAEENNEISYKDANKLKRYVSERGKILPRRITGNCAKHQRALTVEIKRARHMAIMPYVQD